MFTHSRIKKENGILDTLPTLQKGSSSTSICTQDINLFITNHMHRRNKQSKEKENSNTMEVLGELSKIEYRLRGRGAQYYNLASLRIILA